jgi:hypothetical protein
MDFESESVKWKSAKKVAALTLSLMRSRFAAEFQAQSEPAVLPNSA